MVDSQYAKSVGKLNGKKSVRTQRRPMMFSNKHI